jgi:RNA polymerase sigma-70 factor, ECF subfamily
MSSTVRSGRPATRDRRLDDVAAEFANVRPRLLGVAFRILGSWTEAEDTVQDAWLRWQTCDRHVVLNPTAFLVTTTTRLAINAAQSARARHESPVGRWLPEPVDAGGDPALGAERNDALEQGIVLLLQRLSPTERGAYVLRMAFDHPYARIAEILRTSEANARQLVSRAHQRMVAERHHGTSRTPRQRPVRAFLAAGHRQRLVCAFLAAAQQGDIAALHDVLRVDATGRSGRARVPAPA